MKAIFKTKREPGIEVLDVDTPEVGDADILVRVKAASLCGSDVHAYEWTPNYEFLPLPVILGHEFAGDIVQVGAKVTTVSVGDRITAMPGMPCGSCLCCQVGKPDACASRFALGLTGNGAFAEYMRITAGATIFRLPENLDYETASLTEPLAVVMRAVDLSGIKVGQKTAVLGPGPIGLFAVQLLKAAGAGLIMTAGTGNDSMRLKIARELGTDMTINVDKEDIVGMAKRHRETRKALPKLSAWSNPGARLYSSVFTPDLPRYRLRSLSARARLSSVLTVTTLKYGNGVLLSLLPARCRSSR